MRGDRISGPLRKIERSYEHLVDLDAAICAFNEANPQRLAVEEGNKPREYVWRLIDHPVDLPDRFALLIGDVVHNARSALDLLAWQLVDAHPCGSRPTTGTAFPVVRKVKFAPADHWSLVTGKLKGAHPDVVALALDMEFHHGGKGHNVWQLDELDRIDKHVLSLTIPTISGGFKIRREYLERTFGAGNVEDGSDSSFDAVSSVVIDGFGPSEIGPNGEVLTFTLGELTTTDDLDVVLGVGLGDIPGVPPVRHLGDLIESARDTIKAFAPFLA